MPRSEAAVAQDEAWQDIAGRLLDDAAAFDAHWAAYEACYAGRASSDGPPQVWRPTMADIAHSNLRWLADELETPMAGIHAATVEDKPRFWRHSLERLGITYDLPPASILDARSPEDPLWLDGARLNAAAQCFHAPGDHIAIIAGGEGQADRHISYAELQAMAARVSHGLLDMGLVPGDGVALYVPMNVECVAAYLGIVQAGLVAVSIPDSFAPDAVASRLRLGGAKALITVHHFLRGGKPVAMADKALEAAASVGDVRVVSIAADRDGLRAGDLTWDEMLGDETTFTPVPCQPQDVTNVLFSSGTTGEPKAIPWTHLTPLKAAIDGHWHQDIHSNDIVAWPTNIGWMMGPWLIYATFVNRATMALYEGVPTGDDFLRFMDDAKVSVFGVVPAIVRAWRSGGVPPGRLPHVRVWSSTGEASNAHDYLYLMSLAGYRAPVIEYCGGTEIGGGHITGTVVQPASPATFTTPAMGMEFVILDEAGREVPEGGMGEIYLVPPSMGLSQRLLNRDHHKEYYAGCPRGPEGQVLRRHGDEVQRLHQGFYAAQGRADDTMNLGGIKVGSIELERAMDGHPDIEETAAVAVPPEGGGADRLVVFAVTRATDLDALKADLQQRIKTQLNPLFRIHDVVVTDSLPRTASNKVMRRKLRDQYRTVAA